jgi:hypothetical protein
VLQSSWASISPAQDGLPLSGTPLKNNRSGDFNRCINDFSRYYGIFEMTYRKFSTFPGQPCRAESIFRKDCFDD